MKPNYKPKKGKGTGERKIYFEERECDFPTDIYENEICDDDVSDDGDYFTDKTGEPHLKGILKRW
jgi:hypothetical protein